MDIQFRVNNFAKMDHHNRVAGNFMFIPSIFVSWTPIVYVIGFQWIFYCFTVTFTTRSKGKESTMIPQRTRGKYFSNEG